MLDPRPELIFLSGPQQGERVVLMHNEVLAGRSGSAQLRMVEQFVSRRQMRFRLTHKGWVVENVSPSGTRINGKRYKSGQVILLETGDVLEIGRTTSLLFVAPGDDPDEALEGYREGHPETTELPEMIPLTEGGLEGQEVPEPSETDRSDQPGEPAAEARDRDRIEEPPTAVFEQDRRRKKVIKYAIAAALYIPVLVGVFMVLDSLRDRKGGPAAHLKSFTAEEIEEILISPPETSSDSTAAQKALRQALAAYPKRTFTPAGRYRCTRAFKEYLAYYKVFAQGENESKHEEVMRELIDEVTGKYEKALFYEQTRQWGLASERWNQLRRMLPEPDPDSIVRRKLVENIIDHQSYVSEKIRRRR